MNDLLKTKWEKGKNNTLHFYRKKLPWKAASFNTKLLYLPNYFAKMIGDKKEVIIADLGAGMFCTTGSLWKTAKVNIYPSDALSDEFNQILKENGITPLVHVEKQNMENLTYPDNFFDIVHCCNALDHTADPIKALSEMYRTTKPSGFIYLRHFLNVGENEGYAGLHMWNLDINKNGECIIWSQDKKFVLNDLFKGLITMKKKELDYESDDMIVSTLQKPL